MRTWNGLPILHETAQRSWFITLVRQVGAVLLFGVPSAAMLWWVLPPLYEQIFAGPAPNVVVLLGCVLGIWVALMLGYMALFFLRLGYDRVAVTSLGIVGRAGDPAGWTLPERPFAEVLIPYRQIVGFGAAPLGDQVPPRNVAYRVLAADGRAFHFFRSWPESHAVAALIQSRGASPGHLDLEAALSEDLSMPKRHR